MPEVLVTGATGTVGRRLVPLLTAAGADVVALSRDAAKARRVLGEGTKVLEGDLRWLGDILHGRPAVDQVVLISSDQHAELAAAAAGRGRVKRWVKLSAVGWLDEPTGPHREVEQALENAAAPLVVLRANAFMQTLAAYLPLIAPDGAVPLPAGDGRTAWVDASDIAAALAAAVAADGAQDGLRASITGPEALSLAETLGVINARAGTTYWHSDADPGDAAVLLERRAGAFGAFLAGHYRAVAQGAFSWTTTAFSDLTGRPPRSLADVVASDPSPWQARTGARS